MSWSAFNAAEQTDDRLTNISVLLPLFPDDSKSIAMMKHGMDVIKQAVQHLNGDQSPVIAFDQPLFANAKLVQWNWKEEYGEDKFVAMMGPLHIEMAFMKVIGNFRQFINLLPGIFYF